MTALVERPPTRAPAPHAPAQPGRGRHRVPRWLAVPAVVSLLITGLYPAVAGIALAVTDSSLARPLRELVGFGNFVAAAESVAFGGSLLRSALFAVLATLLAVLAGVAGALALHARGGRFGLLGAVLLLPMVTPPVSVGVAWKLLLAPVGGGLTGLWEAIGIGGFNPLGTGAGAFTTLVLIHAWQWAPLVLLLVHAALLGVPAELWEAAALDGAGWWRTLRSVVGPVVAPTVVAAAVLQLVIAFKVFDLVAVVTAGGPGFSTIVAGFEVFRTAFRGSFEVGTAAAETIVLGVLVGLVLGAAGLVTRRIREDT
ncbi:carbohydrate ABC transporter membrane protein 1 (CUT1 family) [Pseudonocardia hierapolitana]|uniref:Carbohydrate ABC transporter membrane protein 1 (CUT1 family) n=1 Tax=Pseudonocardia hierapolitana TaxID=1128676 RepID=A0A561SYA1_9PSEU|nr:sugar ABC transporter permease [Pseudonocardia hierapolitana]TWF79840.1 carbohydrate ABC transporter membrane protein 1 (CUT1 family) [Pseudonocardia hierapolitana]